MVQIIHALKMHIVNIFHSCRFLALSICYIMPNVELKFIFSVKIEYLTIHFFTQLVFFYTVNSSSFNETD